MNTDLTERLVAWPELREHLQKHEALLQWLESRLNRMGIPGIGWVDSAEVWRNSKTGEEKIDVGVERYDEHEHLQFTWEELADESNETWETNQRKRREAALVERAERDKAEAERSVERLERELAEARKKLETSK